MHGKADQACVVDAINTKEALEDTASQLKAGRPPREDSKSPKMAWSFGNIRRPFMEKLKRTDKECQEAWYCCSGRKKNEAPSEKTTRKSSHEEPMLSNTDEFQNMIDRKQRKKGRRCDGGSWRGLAALIAAGILSIFGSCLMWTTDAFDSFVASQMVLDDSKSTFNWWVVPPINPWFKIYIWNYTNLEEFSRNSSVKLKLEQVGPYVYKEKIKRVDIKFNDDATLAYKEVKDYEFSPELTTADLNATVIVPNLPYMGAVAKMNSPLVSLPLSVLLWRIESQPFVSLKANDLIWGYDDQLFSLSKLNFAGEQPPFQRFGLLVSKTVPDRIEINTGASDVNKMSYITSFNGKRGINAWPTESCNSFGGSDGSLFPPLMVHKKHNLFAFKPEACRLIEFKFNKTVQAQGVKAYRYMIIPNTFDSPRSNPDNLCFCNKTDLDQCLPDGVFNTSPCSYGAPVSISYPHFFMADPSVREPFEGLSPNAEEHDMLADIHPRMGMTLRGRSRVQLNVQVRRHPSHTHLERFPDRFILPVAWFAQDLPDYEPDFKTFLLVATYTLDILEFVLLYILPLMAMVTLFFIARRIHRIRSRQIRRWNINNRPPVINPLETSDGRKPVVVP